MDIYVQTVYGANILFFVVCRAGHTERRELQIPQRLRVAFALYQDDFACFANRFQFPESVKHKLSGASFRPAEFLIGVTLTHNAWSVLCIEVRDLQI